MKYCHRPFDFLYLDHFNGDAYLCPWMEPNKSCIGNVLDEEIQEIWNGEKAECIRNQIRNGDFSICRKVACPHLQNNDLPERDELSDSLEKVVSPLTINMAFDFVCNQSCPTCRNEVFIPSDDYQEKVNNIVNKIIPFVNKAMFVTASGHGDPFASPYMMKVLENLRPENKDVHILLETNGVFFDEEHWKRISHLADYNLDIVVTTNSYHKEIYNQISRGGNLEKLKNSELFMGKLRSEGKIRTLTNCMVVQEKNYWEIPEFIEESLKVYGFDRVVLKPIYNWGNLTEEEYWFKDVLNPLHPYHEQYKKIISLPIVKDNPCVYNFGGEMMHEPKPMPGEGSVEAQKAKGYFSLFKKWIASADVANDICSFLAGKDCHNIMIYGAGDVGRAVVRALKKNGVPVLGYIDQFICDSEVEGIAVYRLDCEEVKKAEIVIVTPVHVFENIKCDLLCCGYKGEVINLSEVLS